TASGANVVQWEYTGQSNQHWQVTSVGNGYYSIRAEHSNAALDIAGPTSADGANIIQNAYVGDQNQQWTFQSAGNDYYGIMSRYSGKAVDVEARSQANGGNILQWTYKDRKSTRLNSSHVKISYAVFCLTKKKT